MFFDSWFGILRVVIVGVLAYAALIFWLRLCGKRTLSKWNAFDFVVTIALGSILATVLLSKDVLLVEGIAAFALLVALQFAITWLSVRVDFVKRIIKARPTLLLRDGRMLSDALKAQRVTESEVLAAVRSSGFAALEEVGAVVLETDGTFSVVHRSSENQETALRDVEGFSED